MSIQLSSFGLQRHMKMIQYHVHIRSTYKFKKVVGIVWKKQDH